MVHYDTKDLIDTSPEALQKINFKITSAYIGYNMARVGGYSFTEEGMHGMADFVPHKDVLKLAKKHGIKKIHLAGDWSQLGHRGMGELVPIDTAIILSKKLGWF